LWPNGRGRSGGCAGETGLRGTALLFAAAPLEGKEVAEQAGAVVTENAADDRRPVVGIRAWTMAPAHIGQGSSVTYRVQSSSRHDPNDRAA
jgi:hypothetical protein